MKFWIYLLILGIIFLFSDMNKWVFLIFLMLGMIICEEEERKKCKKKGNQQNIKTNLERAKNHKWK